MIYQIFQCTLLSLLKINIFKRRVFLYISGVLNDFFSDIILTPYLFII